LTPKLHPSHNAEPAVADSSNFSRPTKTPIRPPSGFAAVDARLCAAAVEGRFSGVVLAAAGGEVVYHAAFGVANRDFDVPVAPDTRFNLASMNKMFTAVAVARQIDAGGLRADDALSALLGDEWLPDDVAQRVTVGHLLTHTSGLGNYFTAEFRAASRERYRNIEDYRPLVRSHASLAFEPGADWRYSNIGYMLLGAILERVTGEPYDDHVRREVYARAAMHETGAYPLDRAIPRAAVGYSRMGADGESAWATNLFQHVIRGGPAGGGFSTAADLQRFAAALCDEALLPRAALARLSTPTPQSVARGKPCGQGFFVTRRGARAVIGHTGTFPGISNLFEVDLAARECVVLLGNCDAETDPLGAMLWEALDTLDDSATTHGDAK